MPVPFARLRRYPVVIVAATMLLLSLFPTTARSGSLLISYQGQLSGSSGIVMPDSTYSMAFTLYTDSAGFVELWMETADVLTRAGLFSHLLGSVINLDQSIIIDNNPIFLQVAVGGEAILPRTRLSTAPRAMVAGNLQTTDVNDSVVMVTLAELHQLSIYGTDGSERVRLRGMSHGELRLHDLAGSAAIVLDASAAADEAVVIPDSSINADETLEEPGIALQKNSTPVVLSTNAMTDLDHVEITTPTDGYIVLHGKCYTRFSGTTGPNMALIQIDLDESGPALFPFYTKVGLSGYVNILPSFFSVYTTRTYWKEAGTYEFRLEGMATDESPALAESWDHILTAVFYPTAYGYVGASQGTPDSSHSERHQK